MMLIIVASIVISQHMQWFNSYSYSFFWSAWETCMGFLYWWYRFCRQTTNLFILFRSIFPLLQESLRLLLWCVVWGSLLTNEIIHKRHLSQHDFYLICGVELGTLLHAIW